MKKVFLAALLVVGMVVPQVAMPAATIFSNSTTVKALKDNFDINGKVQFLTGTVDPSSSATSATKGSFYHNTSTGTVYRKTDNGSSTNWVIIGNPTLDNVTIEDSGGLRVKDAGITVAKLGTDAVETAKIKDLNVTTSKLAANAVTQAKRAALGQQVSSSSAGFATTTSGSYVDVTNLTVTITTTGRPVQLSVIPDGTANTCAVYKDNSISSLNDMTVKMVRDSTDIGIWEFMIGSTISHYQPCSVINMIDVVGAGTYVYKLQIRSSTASVAMGIKRALLVAYEL